MTLPNHRFNLCAIAFIAAGLHGSIAFAGGDCNSNGIDDALELPGATQWASTVISQSSEWNATGNYAAEQTLGPPDVFTYGDNRNAWSASVQDGTTEFLLVEYDTPMFATGVTVRETWGSGSVTQIDVSDVSGNTQTVFTGVDPSPAGAIADFRVDFDQTAFAVTRVRVTLSTDATAVWEEIDAIALHGTAQVDDTDCNDNGIPDDCDITAGEPDCNANNIIDGCELLMTQWGDEVALRTSEFNATGAYSADAALGPPEVFTYGDSRNAWSPDMKDGTKESITLQYDTPVYAEGVIVHRNWGVSEDSTTDIHLINLDNMIVHSESHDSEEGDAVDLIEVTFARTAVPIHRVQVVIDTDDTVVWEEIDAIALQGVIIDTAAEDCDRNGIPDSCDIANGEPDCAMNGVPDRCEDFGGSLYVETSAATSQWTPTIYSANQTHGEPDVFVYGDNPRAWSAATRDGSRESLLVFFDVLGPLTGLSGPSTVGITIRETWGAGCVFQVDLLDDDGDFHTMWVGDDPSPPGEIADFTLRWPETDFGVLAARIHIDTDATNQWEQIDSVRLLIGNGGGIGPVAPLGFTDCDGNGINDPCEIGEDAALDCNDNDIIDICESGRATLWASSIVSQSSEFNVDGDYAAEQAVGGPDVFAFGDSPNAWSPDTRDGTTETITVAFDTEIFADGVTIRETWGVGAITQVEILRLSAPAPALAGVLIVEETITDIPASTPGQINDLRIDFPETGDAVQFVRITLDTDATTQWEELDAIALHGVYTDATDENGNGVPDSCEP